MATVIADQTWFLNADKTKAVEEDSPQAAFLLVREGTEIDEAELEKYGLLEDGSETKRVQKSAKAKKAKPESEPEAAQKPAAKKK